MCFAWQVGDIPLQEKEIDVELIDIRTVKPIDKKLLIDSVKKTGRLVIVSEDVLSCGVSAEIAALIAEHALFNLKSPIKRVAVPDTPIPFAPVMESAVIPQTEHILEAVRSVMRG